ncbi:SDR family oxidoreductase [Mesobacillus maritimus]|uniref:SDR family oxidoreductase n=1 Tax=Mesobacillus maritimus TaxID=1643336 RepID=UPI00203E3023|nr:SDR family oxidoreductase [Mesobacillus maritimus]MCM3588844.1 SDR family oxidoreductase [Mesobacillus maritimus]
MKILVVGANGQIGKHLVYLIQNRENFVAKAMIRNQEQANFFENLGAETDIVDLEGTIDGIAKAAEGVDAIVFTAGSGAHTGKDKTIMVDLDGAVKTIEAAKLTGVKRFIMISSFDTTREAIQSAPESFAPYVAAKHYADEWLRATDLDYTIIHPGILTNDKGTGHVKIGSKLEVGEVSRQDVAQVILSTVENESTIGKEFQVIGGSTPVQEAVASVQ